MVFIVSTACGRYSGVLVSVKAQHAFVLHPVDILCFYRGLVTSAPGAVGINLMFDECSAALVIYSIGRS